MTTPRGRSPYRPVRDTFGVPCPQLYITQYVRTDGTATILVRQDRHRSDGSMGLREHYFRVALASPWCNEAQGDLDCLEDVEQVLGAWLAHWFGTNRTLPLPGGWDRGPDA